MTLGETTCKWWRPQSYYDEGGWKGTLALDGGGALMNQAIHNVDLLQWLMGPVTHITGFTAMLAHERIEVEDTAVACLRFANGALGVIQATTSVWPGLPKTIAIHGDKGSAVIEQDDLLRWEFTPELAEDAARFANVSPRRPGPRAAPAIRRRFRTSATPASWPISSEAITTGRPPLVDGREGRKAVEIILAIYQSMATGRVVELKK